MPWKDAGLSRHRLAFGSQPRPTPCRSHPTAGPGPGCITTWLISEGLFTSPPARLRWWKLDGGPHGVQLLEVGTLGRWGGVHLAEIRRVLAKRALLGVGPSKSEPRKLGPHSLRSPIDFPHLGTCRTQSLRLQPTRLSRLGIGKGADTST